MRPDIIIWSKESKVIIIGALWEENSVLEYSNMLNSLRVTSDKDQKMPELVKIDFLRTQPSEAY